MKHRILILLFTILSSAYTISAQLSSGGFPRMVNTLKKAGLGKHEMPAVSNEVLLWEAELESRNSDLKPLRFAHTFVTDINPLNAGTWLQSQDGWHIWQLHIRSSEAYSLNVIFDDFRPRPGDRLFLFTPDYEYLLGSFGQQNVADHGVFPVSPVPGDEMIIQYETRENPEGYMPFKISRVNHDFFGIMPEHYSRRPLGKKAGDCIADVNCDLADRWRNQQNSVMRIMINGRELCTGALVNNTAENQRPYVLTANHCISTNARANSSVFLFNYESPYCGPLDGDISNTISGSTLRATHDSLDFSLVEMSTLPPPPFRPYFSGWSRNINFKDTVAAIHHSMGDIKKVSVDVNIPVVANFGLGTEYTASGFWRINRWEFGVVEIGASGGPLYDIDRKIIGSLVGGISSCSNPIYDYYARFNIAWDRNPDSTRQLKHWLDPKKLNPVDLEGKSYYKGPDLCKAYTNMREGDTHQLVRVTSQGGNGGFFTGTNTAGIREVADKFRIPGDERLEGVSVGIGKKTLQSTANSSYLRIKVYDVSGNDKVLIHTQQIHLKDLVPDAMNLVRFTELVEPADSFLVSLDFDGIVSGDTIAVYHSSRDLPADNSIILLQNGQWKQLPSLGASFNSGALALEVIACNISNSNTDTTIIENKFEAKIYPNPTRSKVELSSNLPVTGEMISVYNIRGQQVPFKTTRLGTRKMEVDLSGNTPGVYLLRIWDGKNHFAGKILLTSF